jgi:hypothetical protein
MPNLNPARFNPLLLSPMKNALYIAITLAAFALAIAVSSGKLGGISDTEAFRRATLTR